MQPKTNTVVVGPKEALAIAEIAGTKFSWAGLDPVASGIIADAADSFDCEVQIRAHADPVAAVAVVHDRIDADGQTVAELMIRPNEPLIGVSPGQTAVVYVGTRVLGQCTIARTVSAVPVSAVPVSA